MQTPTISPSRTSPARRLADSGLERLVSPLADYVSAASDSRSALREIMSMLVTESIANEAEAARYLSGTRS